MKDDEIFVLDNIVSLATQNLIERLVRESVSWKFIPNVAYVDGYTLDQPLKETPGMSQIIYNNALGVNNKDLFPLVLLLIDEVSLKTKLLIHQLLHAKSFLHFPVNNNIKKVYDNIHVDNFNPHTVLLYYVNDSDGDTFLFDKTYSQVPKEAYDTDGRLNQSKVDFKLLKRVTPKKGRLVVFNGLRFHSSSGPTSNMRCVFNINVTEQNITV